MLQTRFIAKSSSRLSRLCRVDFRHRRSDALFQLANSSAFFSFSSVREPLDGIVVGCFEGGKFTSEGALLNDLTKGELQKQWNLSFKKGKDGDAVTLFGISEFPRIAIVGLGKERIEFGETLKQKCDWKEIVRRAAATGAALLKANGAKRIGIESFGGEYQAAAEGATLKLHSFTALKTSEDDKKPAADVFPFSTTDLKNESAIPSWEKGKLVAQAQNFSRVLVETPANLMTPSIFVNKALQLLEKYKNVTTIVREQNWVEEKKMGLFLGVSRGSPEPLRFLEVHYKGTNDPNSKPLVLVGKGITFDTGGISIKPAANMAAMKGDMAGAASVVSAISGIAALGLPIHVIGLTPLCENMPSGTATKPGDVHVAMNGKTVEVDNTDAEGRLILADALHYAHSFNPHTIIDIATLTGAISVALGNEAAGVFSPDDELWRELEAAGSSCGEWVWRMPLFQGYKSQLKSTVADLKNVGGPGGGSCTAATFLKEFTKTQRWMHMDIAGVSRNENHAYAKGMTGIPVRSLIQFAENLSQAKK